MVHFYNYQEVSTIDEDCIWGREGSGVVQQLLIGFVQIPIVCCGATVGSNPLIPFALPLSVSVAYQFKQILGRPMPSDDRFSEISHLETKLLVQIMGQNGQLYNFPKTYGDFSPSWQHGIWMRQLARDSMSDDK